MVPIVINIPYQRFGPYTIKGAGGQDADEVLPHYFDIIPDESQGFRKRGSGMVLSEMQDADAPQTPVRAQNVDTEPSPLDFAPVVGDTVVADFPLAGGDRIRVVATYGTTTKSITTPTGVIKQKYGLFRSPKIVSAVINGEVVNPNEV